MTVDFFFFLSLRMQRTHREKKTKKMSRRKTKKMRKKIFITEIHNVSGEIDKTSSLDDLNR